MSKEELTSKYTDDICKTVGVESLADKKLLLGWLLTLTEAGYTLLTPEEQGLKRG